MQSEKRIRGLLLSALLAFALMSACSSSKGDDPVPPHREARGGFTVVWLSGTPYEMGYQHGTLLHDELGAGMKWLNSLHMVDLVLPILRALGVVDLARNNSYPDIVEECQGLVDAAGDVGWTMDACLAVNFGDVLASFLEDGFPPRKAIGGGCSQIAAAGNATVDGRLYHGRILDWSKIQYLFDYPVVFVRQPSDGISHVYIGFPGNLSPYSGMNAAGMSMNTNQGNPRDKSRSSWTGRSGVQMLGQLLKRAHSLDEARAIIEGEKHLCAILLMAADGRARRAAAFEISAQVLGVREMQDGVVYMTNHFVSPEAKDSGKASDSSLLRFARLGQLIPPGGPESVYGRIDPETLIAVMRDRVNPSTGEESPPDVFDNGGSLATDGAIYEIVYDPEALLFWVAAGKIPVPQQKFVGFSLGELLHLRGARPCVPAEFPATGLAGK